MKSDKLLLLYKAGRPGSLSSETKSFDSVTEALLNCAVCHGTALGASLTVQAAWDLEILTESGAR